MRETTRRKSSKPVTVLVYGDWIVDENWVLAPHESRVSSLEGKDHLRALGGLEAGVLKLCGAGQIARQLYCFDQRNGGATGQRRCFDVLGLGTWGPDDEGWLYQLFDSRSSQGINPFTLHHEITSRRLEGVRLVNLAAACVDPTDGERDEVGTTRLYRLFRSLAERQGGLELEYRIDFVRRCSHDTDSECRHYDADTVGAILRRKLGKGGCGPLGFAVIQDYGHGTVSPSVLDRLAGAGVVDAETCWFVMSKFPRPTWLKAWQREWGRIACWFLHPQAVLQLAGGAPDFSGLAHDSLLPTRWFIGEQRPAREVLQGLDEMFDRFLGDDRDSILLAMPHGLSVLAVEQRGKERWGYYQPRRLIDPQQEELTGRAGTFFGALIPTLVRWCRDDPSTREAGWLRRPLEDAAVRARRGMEASLGALAELATFRGRGDGRETAPQAAGGGEETGDDPDVHVECFSWSAGIGRWKAAFSGTGIVEDGTDFCLDVWRAVCELDGLIEVVADKRREISRLIRFLEDFHPDRASRPLSAMLIARPGSGKSYLVSRLAKSQGLSPLTFNVTQLITREKLIDCFDAIASAQAQDRQARHLVFFDEINALIESCHVYDLFLSLLDDGTYLRNGQLFKLDPCVLLFAGTERLKSATAAQEEIGDASMLSDYRSSKAPDFHSRLTLKAVDLDRPGSEEEIRLGFLYHGAVQLQRCHPEVLYVTAAVLDAFYRLPLHTSIRDIVRWAEKFQDIQYGEVRRRNLPRDMPSAAGEEWRRRFVARSGQPDLDHTRILIRRHPPRGG